MPLRALPPQGSASANFATWAWPGQRPTGEANIARGTPTVAYPARMTAPPAALAQLLESAAEKCRAAQVFGPIFIHKSTLNCEAKASASEATYRLSLDSDKLWVSLVTPDRWLSQSIEADLVHTGDKLEELLAEELADQGYPDRAPVPPMEHFRSEDKLFTFRSIVPADLADSRAADTAAIFLLAYEACFRRLGDMETKEE
jgi:hypothetical protein